MYTKELANAAQVSLDTVRFYTRKGLLSHVKDPDNGYKIYDQQALHRLKFITGARALGFSVKEIEQIIDTSNKGQSPCPDVRELMAQKIYETEQRITQMQTELTQMRTAFNTWQSKADGQPNGKSICCLIETWQQEQQDKE